MANCDDSTLIIYFSGGGVTGVWRRVNELLIRRGAARLLSYAYSRLLVQYCDLVQELSEGAQFKDLPARLLTTVERLLPFTADLKTPIIEFEDTVVRTVESEVQGRMTGFSGLGQCRFRAEPLVTMLTAAAQADFSRFPRIPWRCANKALRGVLVGMLK